MLLSSLNQSCFHDIRRTENLSGHPEHLSDESNGQKKKKKVLNGGNLCSRLVANFCLTLLQPCGL